jgi:hypothetical protein
MPAAPGGDPNAMGQPTYTNPSPPATMSPQQLAALQQAAAAQAAAQPVAPLTPADPASEVRSEPAMLQRREEIRIYSHSPLAYWWPVWLIGYIMAAISYWGGQEYTLADGVKTVFYPSTDLGVAFILTLFLVILITNVTVRGLASVVVILAVLLAVVLLSYLRVWTSLLTWFSELNVFLNTGAYFWFATLMFITWLVTVFVVDHMSYWTIKPGQVTENFVLGASSRSFDTQNIVIEKFRSDLFRHWILGLGSGDLKIETQGAAREQIHLPNVFFIGSKIGEIQNLIATRPTEFGGATFK